MDIGGHRNPISEFISGPSILVVDPFTYSAYQNRSGHGLVRHLKETWASVMNRTESIDCLVLLGSASADSFVIDLVRQFRKVVFESARHNIVVQNQWRAALPELLTTFRLVAHLKLTIPWTSRSDLKNRDLLDRMQVPQFQGDRELWVLSSDFELEHTH